MPRRAFLSPAPLSNSPLILDPAVPIEEETIPGYNRQFFYPVNPGDIFHDRYKTIAKVGWGTCSTVWLARDLKLLVSNPLGLLPP